MLRLTSGLLFLFGVGKGDTYMQQPKGSNNRLNEKSANRNNGNRLFDSQNNNRGGYNVGETGTGADGNGNVVAFDGNTNFGEGTTTQQWDPTTALNDQSFQYDMLYQEGSKLRWDWTAQHGCGNAMNNCNMVLQFGCDNDDALDYDNDGNAATFDSLKYTGLGIRMMMHNGGNTNTPGETATFTQVAGQWANNNNANNGRMESEEFYAMCQNRERQKGFFTADQKLKGHTQKYTRQNPNGQRRGLECPEERDYFPWAFPSPWIDVAWIGNDVEYCKTNIAPFSQNVEAKGACTGGDDDTLPNQDQGSANTEAECQAASGVWRTTSWGGTDSTAWREQFCQRAEWTQVNHLGNAEGTALGGQMASYEWEMPSAADLRTKYKCHEYTDNNSGRKYFRLATRQRYNISTGDYDQYQTFSDQNDDPKNGVISPVTQNPTVDVGAYMQGLRLALNTAQTGRTFQDRSHVFTVFEKPAAAGSQVSNEMLNVNVRGKRGNIVQTFPAMEYDFEPNDITMGQNQCIHLQWTGSNTHNNGNPAGDGQAGDAGEGQGGTDRSNLMEMKTLRKSFPMPYDVNDGDSFFDHVNCKYPLTNSNSEWIPATMVKAILASAGYYYYEGGQLKAESSDQVNALLNNVSASFKQGLVCCTDGNTPARDYYFVSTRNNNFTNRSQKLKIRVTAGAAQQFEFYKA